MNEQTISSFAQLDDAISSISQNTLCRGVSNSSYKLEPSLFRTNYSPVREHNLMWIFKTAAKAHLKHIPQSEVEWLVIAQHHGLPTRLLDWSLSPLVAIFFAIQSLSDSDGAVFLYSPLGYLKEENVDLEKQESIKVFLPSHASPRVTAQSGLFTVHPDNEKVLTSGDLTKLIIPKECKSDLMERLIKYGIHHGTMFPDLDGLCTYIKRSQGYSA